VPLASAAVLPSVSSIPGWLARQCRDCNRHTVAQVATGRALADGILQHCICRVPRFILGADPLYTV